jgi:hypothetical protein
MRADNEEASAGGIITLIGVFLLCGILFVACGMAVDRITAADIKMFSGGIGYSYIRYEIVNLMILLFRAEPIVLLIGAGINYWTNSIRSFSGAISLGVVLQGGSEMIFSTLLLIVFTLFGGKGQDAVLKITESWVLPAGSSEFFAAVQYVPITFYGLMLLIAFFTVVLFVILCVQTVDYANQYTYG